MTATVGHCDEISGEALLGKSLPIRHPDQNDHHRDQDGTAQVQREGEPPPQEDPQHQPTSMTRLAPGGETDLTDSALTEAVSGLGRLDEQLDGRGEGVPSTSAQGALAMS
ncbi:MAG: hypothetical protein M3N25_01525, partial [Actinomycetota bacterium]|nr:hypothetical protein [Actinomycetota bacterium]